MVISSIERQMYPALALLVAASAIFALFYLPALTRLSRGLVSPYHKVDVRRRFTAAAIDASLCVTCLLFYVRWSSPVFPIVGVAYLLFRDGLFGGQSVGKFLVGLVVISLETGKPCTFQASVWRNSLFLLPGMNMVAAVLESVTIVRDPQGLRLGDRVALTQVVDGIGARELVKSVRQALIDEMRSVRDPADEPVQVKRRMANGSATASIRSRSNT